MTIVFAWDSLTSCVECKMANIEVKWKRRARTNSGLGLPHSQHILDYIVVVVVVG